MSKKIAFPTSSSDITIPDQNCTTSKRTSITEENEINQDFETRKQQLIKIGDDVWGENRWSYAVTNQSTDFIDYINGQYMVGAVSFARITLQDGTFREDTGYSTALAAHKGLAIHKARKCSVTMALMEVMLSFSGRIYSSIKHLLKEEEQHRINLKTKLIQTSENDDDISTQIKKITKRPDILTASMNRSVSPTLIERPEKILKTKTISDVSDNFVIDKLKNRKEITAPLAPQLPSSKSMSFSIKDALNEQNQVDTELAATLIPQLPTKSTLLTKRETIDVEHKENSDNIADPSKAERLRRQQQKKEEFKKMFLNQGK